jgi:hypothetical protein
MALNKLLSNSLEVTDSYPDYLPHITLAYVKKGEGSKFKGNSFLNGMTIPVKAFCFSGSDDRKTSIPLDEGRPTILGIDFDGTLVKVNEDYENNTEFEFLPNAKEVIMWMREKGFFLILWTVRTGAVLQKALDFLNREGIKFDSINENAPFFNHPTSNKVYWAWCFDDHCNMEEEINWLKIKKFLQKKFLDQK